MSVGLMVNRNVSERLRGFGNRQTDGRTFAILESLSRLKTEEKMKLVLFALIPPLPTLKVKKIIVKIGSKFRHPPSL